jgi:hypothetical protein
MNTIFPLILTFSLGEKEQLLTDLIKPGGLQAVGSRCTAKMLEAFSLIEKVGEKIDITDNSRLVSTGNIF